MQTFPVFLDVKEIGGLRKLITGVYRPARVLPRFLVCIRKLTVQPDRSLLSKESSIYNVILLVILCSNAQRHHSWIYSDKCFIYNDRPCAMFTPFLCKVKEIEVQNNWISYPAIYKFITDRLLYIMSVYSGIPFLSGQTLWLTLDFVGRKEIDRVSFLTLVDINGTDLETFNITQG